MLVFEYYLFCAFNFDVSTNLSFGQPFPKRQILDDNFKFEKKMAESSPNV